LRAAAAQIGDGIDWKTLQRAEAGKTIPRPSTGLEIAEFYGLKPSDIWPIAASDEPPLDRRQEGVRMPSTRRGAGSAEGASS
jgi:hypothetical protein